MIVFPGRRFGVSSLSAVPRLLRSLAAVFWRDADAIIESARDQDWARYQEVSTRWASRILDVTQTTSDIVGLEHVDLEESYVVASLHESFADAVALMNLPVPLAWVARDELTGWKPLAAFLDTEAAITVSPEEPISAMRTLLSQAPKVFESGRSLVVFPQGTLLGVEAAFSSGAFQIADKYQRPVLPVVVTGTHRVYEYPFSPEVRFGETIRMEVLPPVAAGNAVAEMERVEREMSEVALSAQPGPRRYRPERDGYWDGYAFEISPAFAELAAEIADHRRVAAGGVVANAAKPFR